MRPMYTPAFRTRRAALRGFTLIELMIAVAIAAVLAAMALPSFNSAIHKSRRVDAMVALSAVQQAQERWRTNHSSYSTTLTELGVTSPSRYEIVISGPDSPATLSIGYVATATAIVGSYQANDGNCVIMAVRLVGGNVANGAGLSSVDWTDPDRCWVR